jgi:type II secretion system protein I
MRLKRCDGITILEVLIAMIVMSMALLLLMNMAMVALDGNDWSNNTTNATQLLQEKMEQLRTNASSSLTSGSDTVDGVTRTWKVANVSSHLRRVDVTVTWKNFREEEKVNTMSSYIRTDSV